MVVIGFQAVQFALFTKIYASAEGFLPQDRWAKRVLRVWSLERGLVVGALLGLAGLVGAFVSISEWKVASFGPLHPTHSLRLMVPSATALVVSCQVIFGTFFMSILGIRRTRHPAAEALADDDDAARGRCRAQVPVRPSRPVGPAGRCFPDPGLRRRKQPAGACPGPTRPGQGARWRPARGPGLTGQRGRPAAPPDRARGGLPRAPALGYVATRCARLQVKPERHAIE